MRLIIVAVFLASLVLPLIVGATVSRFSLMDDPTEKMEDVNLLWEEAISAKGGSQRLHFVRSLVVSSRSKNLGGPKDISGDHTELLFVLPDKLWEWVDGRPGAFGLNIFVFDFGKALGWELSDRWDSAKPVATRPQDDDSRADSKYRFNKQRFLEEQLIYMMETKFLKPTLLKGSRTKVGPREADLVEGLVGGEKVEFYLDRKSHLPFRIVFRTKLESGRDYVDVVRLSDYAEVSGIQMPQRVSWAGDEANKTTYQINVDYDPSVFERPPRIDMGPEAWKHRAK